MANRRLILAGAACGILSQHVKASQAWPSKPVRLVVGFPPGTSPDLMARMLAEPLGGMLKQAVIVENKPGAGGIIGADQVAKAGDGHTFGVVGSGALAAAPALYPKLPYGLKDFKAITTIGTSPLLVIASGKLEFTTARDFLRRANAAGEQWSYGSVGVGSSGHLATELLKEKTGIRAVHVPFNGVPAIVNAMAAGDIQLAVVPVGNTMTQVQAGRIKSVAVISAARSMLAPGVPALSEAGVSGFDVEVWNALVAPASVPSSVITALSDAVVQIVRSDDMRQKLLAQGWRAEGTAPQALEDRMRQEASMYGAIAAARGIKLER